MTWQVQVAPRAEHELYDVRADVLVVLVVKVGHRREVYRDR